MAKYGMVIDITKCNGCYNCFLACRDEYCGNDFPPYSLSQPMTGHFWMKIIERERGKYPKVKVAYTPVPCMHCDDAQCVKIAAHDKAIYRRPDGIVIIDPVKARGQKHLLSSCPYRVIYWNEETQIPQKCTLCAHLLDAGWKEPRCVDACPTEALIFGEENDLKDTISKAELLRPKSKTRSRVYYIGLPERFIAGAVYDPEEDECIEDATVIVTESDTGKEFTTNTDNFGDFWFEKLRVGTYALRIEKGGYYPHKISAISTEKDVNVGDIRLYKRKQPLT